MTESRPRSARSLTLTVMAATVALTLVLSAGLWLQMAVGRDPALGAGASVTARQPAAAQKRSVIPAATGDGGPAGGAGPSLTTTAPAYAPSPAPVQTATS